MVANPLLSSAFRNLLNNAIEHATHDTVHVTVTAETADGETIVVSVADDGPGIPDDRKDALFASDVDDLDRLDHGHGLGLHLVHSLVDGDGGTVARNRYGERLVDLFDYLFSAIPGIGSVYRAFRRMGDAMLESEAENFRSVKLVQYPTEGSYMIAFETATTPANVRGATENAAMRTLFVPLAPNPVMGGVLAHFPEERVLDVDMTVEEGIQGLVTSGMAMDADGFTPGELREFGLDDDTIDGLDDQPGAEPP